MEYTDKQLQIIDVAQRLFADEGFEATSVRDIAKGADVNIAMISYYFGSKEKLLEAIFDVHAQKIRMKLENLLNDTKLEPLQKMDALVDRYLDKYFTNECFHRIVAREQMTQKISAISDLLHEMKKQNQELVKKLIQEGQKKNVFKKHVDVPLLMATMLGTANQLITTQHFYKEINMLQDMPEDEFQKHLRKKLSTHIKALFKCILTNED